VCISATDGNSSKFGSNPTPDQSGANFSFLEYVVLGYLRVTESLAGKKVVRSGTSHATVVATVVAAISMPVLRDCKGDFVSQDDKVAYQKTENALWTKRGMQKTFDEMTNMQLERDSCGFALYSHGPCCLLLATSMQKPRNL
jgi:hypothetical protein